MFKILQKKMCVNCRYPGERIFGLKLRKIKNEKDYSGIINIR